MRTSLVLPLTLVLAACGGGVSDEEAEAARAFVDAEIAKEDAALAGISEIEYPDCSETWIDGRPTKCGAAVFLKSMGECSSRSAIWAGEGTTRLEEFAGPSWIERAGRESILGDEERLKTLRSEDSYEVIALAGGGIRAIRPFACQIEDMRLVSIERRPPIN